MGVTNRTADGTNVHVSVLIDGKGTKLEAPGEALEQAYFEEDDGTWLDPMQVKEGMERELNLMNQPKVYEELNREDLPRGAVRDQGLESEVVPSQEGRRRPLTLRRAAVRQRSRPGDVCRRARQGGGQSVAGDRHPQGLRHHTCRLRRCVHAHTADGRPHLHHPAG